MLNEHDVLALLQYSEKIDLECKEAKNDVPKSIWETYSSFANTKGGTILLGIKEISDAKLHEENRYEIQGIKNIEANACPWNDGADYARFLECYPRG